MNNEGDFQIAYKRLLKDNTRLNAEVAALKGQFNEALEKLGTSVKQLDKTNLALEKALIKALRIDRRGPMSDEAIIDWTKNNNVPISLRVVADESDAFQETYVEKS